MKKLLNKQCFFKQQKRLRTLVSVLVFVLLLLLVLHYIVNKVNVTEVDSNLTKRLLTVIYSNITMSWSLWLYLIMAHQLYIIIQCNCNSLWQWNMQIVLVHDNDKSSLRRWRWRWWWWQTIDWKPMNCYHVNNSRFWKPK